MPLLGGIFKKKSRSNVGDAQRTNSLTSSKSEADSPLSSPTSEYVKTGTAIPSSPNGGNTLHPNNGGPSRSVYPNAAASSSRLRLGFGRKKGSAAGSAAGSTHDEEDYFTPPRPNFTGRNSSSAASDSDAAEFRRLGPPPSKSAIFAAQEGVLSTRSLPNETVSLGISTPPSAPSKKRPSLFPWSAKSQSSSASKASSKQLKSDDVLSPTSLNEDSFNLKSFRHVRAPSTEPPLNSSSNSLIPPPIPGARPRNGSVGSDSSQRISVAAFREAQARRSAAGSPVPSLRSPSPHGIPALPLSQSSLGDIPHTRSRQATSPQNQRKRSSLALGLTSSDEEESSEEDSEDDEDGNGLSRRRTVTHRMNGNGGNNRGRATKSELGHGSSSSSSTHHLSRGDEGRQTSHSQLNTNVYASGVRPRASASTSALTPNAAAKRASVLASANSEMAMGAHVREKSLPNVDIKAQDSDESEDDAPLATLVAPRRPGSALSQGSNTSQPNRPKPLIDINALTGPNKRAPETGAKPKSQAGFTGGNTLLSGVGPSTPAASTATSPLASVTSTSPPMRFVSPPSSPKGMYKGLPTAPSSNSTAPQTPNIRKAPVRKDTDTISIMTTQTSSSGGQSGQESGKKRDNLSERLRNVAQARIGSSSPSGSSSTNTKLSSGFGDDLVIPRTTSPSSINSPVPPAARQMNVGYGRGHRRASSDYTLKLDTYTSTSPSTSAPSSAFPQSSTVTSPISIGDDAEPDTMEDLASLLGPGIKLVTKNGETSPTEELKVELPQSKREPPSSPGRIAPVVIKQRTPVPSFSVTSRPQHRQNSASVSADVMTSTTATITLTATSSGTSTSTSTSSTTRAAVALNDPPVSSSRQRSSTLTITPTSDLISPSKSTSNAPVPVHVPVGLAKPKAPVARTVVSSSEESSSSSEEESDSESNRSPVSTAPASASRPPIVTSKSSFGTAQRRPANPNAASRPRSSTTSSLVSMPASQSLPPWNNAHSGPTKPFAISRESPASSTGDSSSGRVPITPRDGSDIGGSGSDFGSNKFSSRDSSADRARPGRHDSPSGHQKQYSGGASGLGLGKHIKRASVSFEDSGASKGKGRDTPEEEEERRRERRRTEAKAAIDLGNVINGRGPVVDDDDDDLPISQTTAVSTMGAMNPMMTGSMPMMPGFPSQPGAPGWGAWPQMPPNPQMSQFMVPPPSDPSFFAAHQQAMMFAKQAYQMAVAQQAMAAAAEEWERGSAIGFSSSQSMYGGASGPPMMSSPYGMGMGGGNGWSTGSVIFPSGPRSSVYGGGAQSEYGGGGRGGGWNSSRSVYGESFGPSPSERLNRPSFGGQRSSVFSQRDSSYFPPVPPVPQQHKNQPRQSTASSNPRNRAISQPSSPARTPKKPPPSSWKAGV